MLRSWTAKHQLDFSRDLSILPLADMKQTYVKEKRVWGIEVEGDAFSLKSIVVSHRFHFGSARWAQGVNTISRAYAWGVVG